MVVTVGGDSGSHAHVSVAVVTVLVVAVAVVVVVLVSTRCRRVLLWWSVLGHAAHLGGSAQDSFAVCLEHKRKKFTASSGAPFSQGDIAVTIAVTLASRDSSQL